ncbi:Eco57I restriction-modification methylase domain-containing protein [uncultured Xanthomonas sp.]|uniref:Eco57I restriction-modification methylase domain-containing protein n=1 Tax=uncultured Xanthomonas sp. TaxID=152831 RepID=UPI0037482DD2
MLHRAELQRREVAGLTPRPHKSAMGQFMTNADVAAFMVSLLEPKAGPHVLLDPGAGLGALSCAVLDSWKSGKLGKGSMAVEAHELDSRLREHLEATLVGYEADGVKVTVREGDYLAAAADDLEKRRAPFTLCVMNPPYKKIATNSDARTQARRIGLETVNLYSAFVGAALEQMAKGGQLVAIIPRSFANGPYYKPFRRFILERASLKHIHLFDSRTKAFRDDEVLQENVILLLERGGKQGEVTITSSTDDSFTDLRKQVFPFSAIVKPQDRESFIHVPTEEADLIEASPLVGASLAEVGVSVSTGPIVDFRTREHLRAMPEPGTVPLIYAFHIDRTKTTWPIEGAKKANALVRDAITERSIWPTGYYVVVRRFSSKEEKRRVVAYLVQPQHLDGQERLAFENHSNVFHFNKRGLEEDVAWGLFVYLNSTALDDHLRRFSGHTQVNATDLRNMPYPTREVLEKMGRWAKKAADLSQTSIDKEMEQVLA